jgi:hypothetical protein
VAEYPWVFRHVGFFRFSGKLPRLAGDCSRAQTTRAITSQIREVVNNKESSMTRNLGMLLLAIYLIVSGAIAVLGLAFANMALIVGVLAIAAGICILLGR